MDSNSPNENHGWGEFIDQFFQWEIDKTKTILDYFDAQVRKNSEATALIFKRQSLTFRELDTRSNQLAHYLSSFISDTKRPIGIAIPRSADMVIGLLGIMKTGTAYVPLDPTHPKNRLQLMIEDANVEVLLGSEEIFETLSHLSLKTVSLDKFQYENFSEEPLNINVKGDDTFLVSFTSGSTGRPKGVKGHHTA
ncbi:MAG: AMP-binding protein [Chloroflexota bacterium]